MTLRHQHHVNWDPKNFEIRTLSVERQLEQLVKQVTTLVSGQPSNYRKGQSKSGTVLIEAVDRALDGFMQVGHEVSQIASKYGTLGNDMNGILQEIATSGASLKSSAG